MDRKTAFAQYEKWKNSQTYTHTILNDEGDEVEQECTKYVAHYEHRKAPQKRIRYTEGVSNFPGIQESNDGNKRLGTKNG